MTGKDGYAVPGWIVGLFFGGLMVCTMGIVQLHATNGEEYGLFQLGAMFVGFAAGWVLVKQWSAMIRQAKEDEK